MTGARPWQEVDVDDAQVRQRLTERLAAVQQQLSWLTEDRNQTVDTGSPAHSDVHPADVATDLESREEGEALLAAAQAQLLEVEAALARLERGDYGRCVDCGAALPAERLEVRPEAARCVTDQSRLEAVS